jgi:hypothetical protein
MRALGPVALLAALAFAPCAGAAASNVCIIYGTLDQQPHVIVVLDDDAQATLPGGPCTPRAGEAVALMPVATYATLDAPGLAAAAATLVSQQAQQVDRVGPGQ